MDKVKFVIVYKTGPKFNKQSIYLLRNQVLRYDTGNDFEFLCITDHKELLAEHPEWTLELERKDVKGWWCLPEKFRITGPVMFTGIDTVICGDLAPFARVARACVQDEVYMIHPFRIPNRFNRLYANGVMLWNGNHKWLYDNYDYAMAEESFPLEQDYTSAMFIKHNYNIKVVQKAVDGVVSWKVSMERSMEAPPKGTRIMLFHGKQKPHLFTSGWISDHLKRFKKDMYTSCSSITI